MTKRRAPPPTGTSLVPSVAGVIEVGTNSISVKAWALDAPSLEYYADGVACGLVAGSPTLYFAQRGPDETIINAVGVAMTANRFRDMVNSFKPVLGRMSPESLKDGRAIGDQVIVGLNTGNFRKFVASFVRGGVGDDHAMMDFYRMALFVPEQMVLQRGLPPDLVQPCIRVFMSPAMFVHIFDSIARKGLAP